MAVKDISWLNLSGAEFENFLGQYDDTIIDDRYNQTTLSYKIIDTSFSVNSNDYYAPYLPANESFMQYNIPASFENFISSSFNFIDLILDLDFVETPSSSADIYIGSHNMVYAGYADYPSSAGSFIWLDNEDGFDEDVFVHELGHKLGLSHPADYSENDDIYDNNPDLPDSLDTKLLTIESYNSEYNFEGYRPLDWSALIATYGRESGSVGITYNLNFENSEQGFVVDNNSVDISKASYWVLGTDGYDSINYSPASRQSSEFRLHLDASQGVIGYYDTFSNQLAYHNETYIYQYALQDFINLADSGTYVQQAYYIYPYQADDNYRIERATLGTQDDVIIVGDKFDLIESSSGDDAFHGFNGNLTLDGGEGNDKLTVNASVADFTIDSATQILRKSDASVMNLDNIELIEFADIAEITLSNLLSTPIVSLLADAQLDSRPYEAKVQAYFFTSLGRAATDSELSQFMNTLANQRGSVWKDDSGQKRTEGSLVWYIHNSDEFQTLTSGKSSQTIVNEMFTRMTGTEVDASVTQQYIDLLDNNSIKLQGLANALLNDFELMPVVNNTLDQPPTWTKEKRDELAPEDYLGYLNNIEIIGGVDVVNFVDGILS